MKKKLFIGIGLLVALGGSALVVVGMAGVPEAVAYGEPGRPEYYTSERFEQPLPDIMVNLAVKDRPTYLQIKATAVCRVGGPLKVVDTLGLFSAAEAHIRDAFIMLLGSKTPEDVLFAEQKEILKTQMKNKIQKIVFPQKHGRVEEILFRQFQVQ